MSLADYFAAQERTRTAVQDCERAAYNRDLCRMRERIAMLISQHEPVNGTGLDRDKLACVLRFVEHGQLARLSNELEECAKIELAAPAVSHDGWITWHGGKCPVPADTPVQVWYRAGGYDHTGRRADRFIWQHIAEAPRFDIVKYRRKD